jgi:hypothetical protein
MAHPALSILGVNFNRVMGRVKITRGFIVGFRWVVSMPKRIVESLNANLPLWSITDSSHGGGHSTVHYAQTIIQKTVVLIDI